MAHVFIREDWTQFRSLDGLMQMAGVPRSDLPKLVMKELVDNALDASGSCQFGLMDGCNGFWVEDDGPGFPGTPEEVADLFSINRPLISSKLLRLPTRGALGNGLRVVVGAAVSTGGRIEITSKGRRFSVVVDDDGRGRAEGVAETEAGPQCVRVVLGPTLPVRADDLAWSKRALSMAGHGTVYDGRTSAWWYDSAAFHELLLAAKTATVRQMIEAFDGCSGGKAGRLAAPFGKNRQSKSLSFDEADKLLGAMRGETRRMKASRLGRIGLADGLPGFYKRVEGIYTIADPRGDQDAEIPFVVEAWATEGAEKLPVCVNRTPAPGTETLHAGKEIRCAWGGKYLPVKASKPVSVMINVTTPYVAKMSTGKTPDLQPFLDEIHEAVRVAAGRCRKVSVTMRAGEEANHKDAIISALPEAIAASGNGEHRFSQRQLYYRVRPIVKEMIGEEPGWKNFCNVLTDYEADYGEVPGMFRDVRGTIYHPHTGESIPLGTLAVENYERPDWTFNKLLYIEKEGFFEVLKAVRWPERHDCALMTAKGFSSRAARDLIDYLGTSGEPTTFYCVHDADASGSMIYQTLQGATKARGERTVRIVNLGLDPAEALEMQLQVESITTKSRATASYLDDEWREWLQSHRVELEAMTSEEFLRWLDKKMEEQEGQKVVPPPDVLADDLRAKTIEKFEGRTRAQLEEEAGIAAKTAEIVAEASSRLVLPASDEVEQNVRESLESDPGSLWKRPIDRLAEELAESLRSR
ncbi:MAG: hypothetical protein KIT58_04920 [Planctomycetota bacterium]|nr:hypothetical protein [Planctomycetota bacterium]